jgi:four helix bundle protein
MPGDRPSRNYRRLRVWRRGIDLVEAVYALIRGFPAFERFGLSAQLQRAAVSVPSNIAEGNERESRTDHQRFVTFARGSLAEVDTQLEVALRLGYADVERLVSMFEIVDELGGGLYNLRRNLPR